MNPGKILLLSLLFVLFSVKLYSEDNTSIKLTQYVTDSAFVLDNELKDSLEARLDSFHQKTTSQLALLTVKDMGGLPIENFAYDVFDFNKLGTKDKNNGVLVVFSKEDRKVRIEVGYGLEPYLPDAACSRIINGIMIPSFKEEQYDKGFKDGMDAILTLLEAQKPYEANTEIKGEIKEESKEGFQIPFVVLYIILAVFFVVGYLLARRCDAIRIKHIKKFYLGKYSISGALSSVLGNFTSLLVGFIFMFGPALGMALTSAESLNLEYSRIFLLFGGVLGALIIFKFLLLPLVIVKLFLRQPINIVWSETKEEKEEYKKYGGSSSDGGYSSSRHSIFDDDSSSSSSSIGEGGSSGGGGASGSW
jgi:uncharacterized protein